MYGKPARTIAWGSVRPPVKPRPYAFAMGTRAPVESSEKIDDADIVEVAVERTTMPMPVPMPEPKRTPPPPISSPIPLVRRVRPHQPLKLDLGYEDAPEDEDDVEDVDVDVSRFLPKRRTVQWVTCLLAIGIAVGLWRDPSARTRAALDARALNPWIAEALASPRRHPKHAAGASRVASSAPLLEPVSSQPSAINVDWTKPKRR